MTLKQLQYFMVLSKTCHFLKAANELYVSQSSLSYSISELESELGVVLFERQAGRTRLTKLGKEYAALIEPILENLDKANKRIRTESKKEQGEVFVGVFPSLYNGFSGSIIRNFYKENPKREVIINFHSGRRDYDLFQAMESGIIEMTFCNRPKPNMENKFVFKQTMKLFVPQNHLLAERTSVCFDDIKNEEYIDVSTQYFSRLMIDDIFRGYGCERKVVNEQTAYSFVLNYVANGLGLAILPYTVAFEKYGAKAIEIEDDSFKRDVYLAWMEGDELSASAKKVRDYLTKNGTQIYLDSFLDN